MPNTTPKLSDFKALLFDIDRTLTNTSSEVSRETLIALEELSKKGIQIGVCSGRGTPAIKNKILPLFPDSSVHITTSGSQLINSKGKIIWDHPIDVASTKNLREFIEKLATNDNSEPATIFMKTDALYAKEPTLTNLKKHHWNFVVKNINQMSNDGVGAIFITNLNDKILNYVKDNPDLSFKHMIGNSGNPYIDVTAKGVNKATTLKKWSQHTGIPTKKIIGFGDSANDIEFLKACGFSVAMGNATEEVKQITDRTIGHTNDNSLAKYLTKIIQGENL